MLEWVNKTAVRSSDGYELHRVDRWYYEYRCDGKVLRVPLEPGLKAYEVFLSRDMRWSVPFEKCPLSAEELAVIGTRLSEALAFMGHNSVVRGNSKV
jgi:hypothetical protein